MIKTSNYDFSSKQLFLNRKIFLTCDFAHRFGSINFHISLKFHWNRCNQFWEKINSWFLPTSECVCVTSVERVFFCIVNEIWLTTLRWLYNWMKMLQTESTALYWLVMHAKRLTQGWKLSNQKKTKRLVRRDRDLCTSVRVSLSIMPGIIIYKVYRFLVINAFFTVHSSPNKEVTYEYKSMTSL